VTRTLDLTGRTVLITGAAGGIGSATARAFAARGARVVVTDVDHEAARALAEELGAGHGFGYRLDVTDPDEVNAVFDRVELEVGPVDVVVNNAGIMPITAFVDESAASVRRQLAINVEGVVHGCQAALRRMTPRGTGAVVNVASAAGRIGYPGVATYSATKFAVVGLTDTLAREYADSGVVFTCVMPSLVNTDLASGVPQHRLLRTLEPTEVATAIVDGVRHRRRHVTVPNWLGSMNTLHSVLPTRVGDSLLRRLGADHQILDSAGVPERRAYEKRATGEGAGC
jgi:NAD(P)-dependent dehydrogenase (short-subunit alcohol dehydrogenase family)